MVDVVILKELERGGRPFRVGCYFGWVDILIVMSFGYGRGDSFQGFARTNMNICLQEKEIGIEIDRERKGRIKIRENRRDNRIE